MTNNILNPNIDDLRRQEKELRSSDDGDLLVESKLSALLTTTSTNVDANEEVHDHTGDSSKTKGTTFEFVPLRMVGTNGRTHAVSGGSKRIMEEVTIDDLKKLTTSFYDKAFMDKTLDKFVRSHDDPHAERFALWIHQKLTGSTVWDDERRNRDLSKTVTLAHGIQHVVHDRTSAHAGAWYSPKRPNDEVGRHFNLEECRVWMRLHFWALRESGLLDKSPSFVDYYIRFIGHFVRVYENSAPKFARESFRWSSDPANVDAYLLTAGDTSDDNRREMTDVLGLSRVEAESQLPPNELEDYVWPYNQEKAD